MVGSEVRWWRCGERNSGFESLEMCSIQASFGAILLETFRTPHSRKAIFIYTSTLRVRTRDTGRSRVVGLGYVIYMFGSHLCVAAAMTRFPLESYFQEVPDFCTTGLQLSPFSMSSWKVYTWQIGRSRLLRLGCIGHKY